mgnify:CR=1 FL=1
MEIESIEVLCDEIVKVDLIISNLGDTIINEIEFEVQLNGLTYSINYPSLDIPFSQQELVSITLDENLLQSNEIVIDIFSLNSQNDENLANNWGVNTVDLINQLVNFRLFHSLLFILFVNYLIMLLNSTKYPLLFNNSYKLVGIFNFSD